MKKYVYLLMMLSMAVSLYSCEEETGNQSFSVPTIETETDFLEINLNLNKDDNIFFKAAIHSDAGLSKVNIKIATTNETIVHLSITKFNNKKYYNLSETLTFNEGYEKIIIEAIDILNQTTTKEFSINIIGEFSAPVITFSSDSVLYNLLFEKEIPATEFTIVSKAGLKRVEMFFKTREGYIEYSEPIQTLGEPEEFSLSRAIVYDVSVIGFEVRAIDKYDKISISTLPIIVRRGYPEIFLNYNPGSNREFSVYSHVEDSLYAMFKVVHQKSEQHNRDYWRVLDSYLAVYQDGAMTRSLQILTAGENEFVWISNRPNVSEFTGGYHGNERIDRDNCFARFYLDSIEIDLARRYNMERGTSFFYHQVSLMYETGTGGTITSPGYKPVINAPVECTHEKLTRFADGGYNTYNKVVWTENTPPIKKMYYGIFCITGDISSHGYNDTGISNPVIVPFVNDGAMKLRSSSQRVVMFHLENNISVECDAKLLRGGSFPLATYIWDHAIYHKYYTAIEGSSPVQTAKDEVWETEASIKFKIYNSNTR